MQNILHFYTDYHCAFAMVLGFWNRSMTNQLSQPTNQLSQPTNQFSQPTNELITTSYSEARLCVILS